MFLRFLHFNVHGLDDFVRYVAFASMSKDFF